jgi:REP element-mobilizing transposase RayT
MQPSCLSELKKLNASTSIVGIGNPCRNRAAEKAGEIKVRLPINGKCKDHVHITVDSPTFPLSCSVGKKSPRSMHLLCQGEMFNDFRTAFWALRNWARNCADSIV